MTKFQSHFEIISEFSDLFPKCCFGVNNQPFKYNANTIISFFWITCFCLQYIFNAMFLSRCLHVLLNKNILLFLVLLLVVMLSDYFLNPRSCTFYSFFKRHSHGFTFDSADLVERIKYFWVSIPCISITNSHYFNIVSLLLTAWGCVHLIWTFL